MNRIVMEPLRRPLRRALAASAGMALLALLGLAACAPLPIDTRRADAEALAQQAGWAAQRIATTAFVLQAYAPRRMPATPNAAHGTTLTVYIEGDGLAWRTARDLSDDPTPRQPVALQLALRHPHDDVAYLARPCQYVQGADARNCDPRYWSDARFAPEVVQATDQALTTLMHDAGARELVLVGYSGGAAVAALVAAQRNDVRRLVTVAGNLDHAAWTRWHRVSPLSGSLNPADAWQKLRELPQTHLVGALDSVMPPALVQAYVERYPVGHRPQVRVLPGQDHGCCWAQAWPELAAQVLP